MENLILNNVKKWFIDRDLENGGRLDKQSKKCVVITLCAL